MASVKKLAENIKHEMAFKGITAYQLCKEHKIHKSKVYAVLQMGEKPAKSYNIKALFQVLDAAGIKLIDVAG